MNNLKQQIQQNNAKGFTHSGKFHADDVFSTALLFYINPEIQITRGNKVPEDFEGIVYDIGRGTYDHHQKDSRVRENGIPYAAFGLLWEELGGEILGDELAERFDEEFVQPLDQNDNTGDKNELASLIGTFNLAWDQEGSNDDAFFQAVSVAGMILENKFAKYKGNERADQQVEVYLMDLDNEIMQGRKTKKDKRILVMPKFVPCQKRLSETEIEFIVFPSNRGGYCIQPLKKMNSMNYKCSFPQEWLGLEGDELQSATGLKSASFCHKGGFLMTVGELEDAVEACHISQEKFVEKSTIVVFSNVSYESEESKEVENAKIKLETLLCQIPEKANAKIRYVKQPDIPELGQLDDSVYLELQLEKGEWKQRQKDIVKKILREKPELVYVEGEAIKTYPVIHLLRKKHIPVVVKTEQNGIEKIVRIPSGS